MSVILTLRPFSGNGEYLQTVQGNLAKASRISGNLSPYVLQGITQKLCRLRAFNQFLCRSAPPALTSSSKVNESRQIGFLPTTTRKLTNYSCTVFNLTMIEKIYIVRHGECIPKLIERPAFIRQERIPAQLGHYQLVRHDHKICPHRRTFLTESFVGRVQPAYRETHLSRRMGK